jgi:hypothetical protein
MWSWLMGKALKPKHVQDSEKCFSATELSSIEEEFQFVLSNMSDGEIGR